MLGTTAFIRDRVRGFRDDCMREAILHLSDEQLAAIGLAPVVSAAREAGLRDLTELVCHGPGGIILFRVREPLPEDEFGEFRAVEWWERLATTEDGLTYLCKIDAPELPEDFSPEDLGVAHDIADARAGGIDLTVIGSREDISRSVAAASDAGMDLVLERLSDYRGKPTALDALTDRQREIVETAYEMGYYDVPRQASSAAIATEVGLDASTVAEHLQRAERNLMNRLVGKREPA